VAQFAVLVTYREIFGKDPKIEELHAILSKYGRCELLFLLAKLNCLLGTWQNTPNFEEDRKLTRVFLPNDAYRIERMRADLHRIVFSRMTLLYLMKQVCRVCTDDGGNPHTFQAYAEIGVACLLANDLLLPFLPSPNDGDLERLANLLPFSDYVPHDHYAFEIARSQKMFEQVSQFPALKSRSDFLDVLALFNQAMGISHSRFTELVFGCSTKFLNLKVQDLFQPDAMVVRVSFFQKSNLPAETVSGFFSKMAIPLTTFAENVKSSDRPANDLTLFQASPLVQIVEGVYTCLDPGFLVEKAGRGLYWTLFSEMPGQQKGRLATFWGAIFEAYANLILQESYKARGTFIAEPRFPNGDQAFDACIIEGANLIVFEHKSSTLRADCKYGGDIEKLRAELDLKFIQGDDEGAKGLAQLKKSILRFVNGEDLEGISSKQIRRIYPVLVCLDSSVTVPYMAKYFNGQFRPGIPRRDISQSITPIFVLGISDLENLAGYLNSFLFCDICDSFYEKNRSMLGSISSSEVPLLKNAQAAENVIAKGFSEFGKRMEEDLFGGTEAASAD
ncbi:MAG TPA: hypothetical protein VFA85_17120, partial [Terriglobales bacterium]|nr:hypothetical protein [Terriglobales bacterium]